jgi:ferric-dicitrate binding protein FerR (iron transport regulator)
MLQHRFWNLLAKKLANEATAEETQELEDLMRVHPEWHYAAQHIEDIWGLSLKDNPQAAEDSYLRHLNRMKKIGIAPADPEDDETNLIPHHPNRNKKRLLLFSIIGLAILAIVLFYNPNRKKGELPVATTSEVSTRLGSRSKLVLPDGSTVWLNAGSKLIYDKEFGSRSREVTLVGEGFFEVTRMNDLPFIIQTPTMQVKVLGTTFNVKSYLDESTSETSVIEGSVEVLPKQRPGEKFVLKPNEKLVLSNASNQEVKNRPSNTPMVVLKSITYTERDSAVVETSWVENKLVFDDEPFAEVALKMERWYAVKIIFEDKNIERMHLTGSFVNENIQQALGALQLTSNFKYEINQNKITITK